jgi:uncharacterized membrane protein
MNQHLISRVAIIILSIVMIVFGIYHWTNPKDLVGYVPPYLPGVLMVKLVGVAFILAAISFLSNKLVKIAAYMLALLLLIFVSLVHLNIYMNAGAEETKVAALINILKDTALAAFALHIAGSASSKGMVY